MADCGQATCPRRISFRLVACFSPHRGYRPTPNFTHLQGLRTGASRAKPRLQNGPLRPRVDAYERLGDLDGVRRGALEEVVCDAPVLDHTPLHAYPPDVGPTLTGDLERRRELRWVVREADPTRSS